MKMTVLGLALLIAVGLAGPLTAATANFQGNCQAGIPTHCQVDALRPAGNPSSCSNGAFIYLTRWEFGDRTPIFYSHGTSTSHTYGSAGFFSIKLTVFCSDGTSATATQCMSNFIGLPGCIRPGAGWTP